MTFSEMYNASLILNREVDIPCSFHAYRPHSWDVFVLVIHAFVMLRKGDNEKVLFFQYRKPRRPEEWAVRDLPSHAKQLAMCCQEAFDKAQKNKVLVTEDWHIDGEVIRGKEYALDTIEWLTPEGKAVR